MYTGSKLIHRVWDEIDRKWLYVGFSSMYGIVDGIVREFYGEESAHGGCCVGHKPMKHSVILNWGIELGNGKEFFVGDIVINPDRNGGRPHIVVFEKGCFCGKYGVNGKTLYSLWDEPVKKVGNVYENPELLDK